MKKVDVMLAAGLMGGAMVLLTVGNVMPIVSIVEAAGLIAMMLVCMTVKR